MSTYKHPFLQKLTVFFFLQISHHPSVTRVPCTNTRDRPTRSYPSPKRLNWPSTTPPIPTGFSQDMRAIMALRLQTTSIWTGPAPPPRTPMRKSPNLPGHHRPRSRQDRPLLMTTTMFRAPACLPVVHPAASRAAPTPILPPLRRLPTSWLAAPLRTGQRRLPLHCQTALVTSQTTHPKETTRFHRHCRRGRGPRPTSKTTSHHHLCRSGAIATLTVVTTPVVEAEMAATMMRRRIPRTP